MATSNTQSVKRIRGSAAIADDGTFDFRPDGQGPSRQELVAKQGKSRLYKTSGEKQQSFVAHLSTSIESSDPADDLRRDLEKMLQTQPGYVAPPASKGRLLSDGPWGKLCLNRSAGTIECNFRISLKEHPDYMKEYYKLLNSIAQCLYYNNDSIVQLSRALAKCGTK